jgi:hypothetical protein
VIGPGDVYEARTRDEERAERHQRAKDAQDDRCDEAPDDFTSGDHDGGWRDW